MGFERTLSRDDAQLLGERERGSSSAALESFSIFRHFSSTSSALFTVHGEEQVGGLSQRHAG